MCIRDRQILKNEITYNHAPRTIRLKPPIALYEKRIGVLFSAILTHLSVNFGASLYGQFQFTKRAHYRTVASGFLGCLVSWKSNLILGFFITSEKTRIKNFQVQESLRRSVSSERAKLNSKCFPLLSGRHVDAQYGVSTLSGTLWVLGSEFPRRLCDPLPQYDFIMSAVTLHCKYSTSSSTLSEFIENLAACS